MASGLGKTMTAIFDIERYLRDHPDSKVLYLCDSVPILQQVKEEFKAFFGEEYSYALLDNKHTPKRKVNFLFGSFCKLANSLGNYPKDEFDYIVVDEAHHAQATTYRRVVLHFCPSYLLGLTATPVRLDQRNIEDIFGEPIFNLGLARALAEGLLTPIDYRIMDDGLNIEEITRFMQSSEKISLNQLNRLFFLPCRDEEIVRIIRERIVALSGKRTIIFCKNINHAEEIARLMPEAKVVHSDMPYEVSDKQIHDFKKGKVSTIIAVDKLNEGVDIPEVDVIVFLRTTTSPTVLLQQMGRGLRLVPGKECVHVLDFVANYERLLELDALQREIANTIDDETKTNSSARSNQKPFAISMPSKKFVERHIDLGQIIAKTAVFLRSKHETEQLYKEYADFYYAHGRFPNRDEITIANGFSCEASAYYRLFGSIFALKQKIIGEKIILNNRTISDYEILESYRNKALQLGRLPSIREINADKKMPSWYTFQKKFGSKEQIVKLIGLEKFIENDFDKAEAIATLQRLRKELGRLPLQKDLKSPKASVYRKLFGSWDNALIESGLLEKPKRHVYTKKEAIAKAKILYTQLGRAPFLSEMSEPSSSVCIKLFGSWKSFIESCGMEVNPRGGAGHQDYLDRK